jgi:hypothetical protein
MGNANTTKKAIVNTSYLRVRTGPSKRAAIIGLLKQGAVVDVLKVVDGWASIEIRVGGAVMRLQSSPDPVLAYLQVDYLTFDSTGVTPDPTPEPTPAPRPSPAPAPTPAVQFAMGINALQNTSLALEEARRGCKYFLIMDDFGGAANLKRAHPQATVMVRRYFPQNFFLSPDQVLHGLEGAQHGALVYTGFNEADQGGQDGDELRTRARIDIAIARKIKERNPGAIYAAGTFSMGTPDFTNPDTCRIIREEYAPHYNNGLIALDMHLYSPNPPHIDKPAEWQWFERRWEFLFTKCGFDPKVRAIYCSETGLDQGGIGGFPAHGATQQYFRDWCRKYITLQSAPMVINGKSYPSPIIGGAIFQLGGNGDQRWQGYNIAGYLPVLRESYSGASTASSDSGARRSLPKLLPEIRLGGKPASTVAKAIEEPEFDAVASGKTAAERLKSALSQRTR